MSPSPPTPEPAPSPGVPRRRAWRWPLVVLGLLVALRVALPELARRGIEHAGSDALGRTLAVEQLDLGLLRGRIELRGLSIGGATPGAPELGRAGRIALDLGWRGLLHGDLIVDALELSGVRARLQRRTGGSLEPIVLAPPRAPAAEADAAARAAGRPLRLTALRLEQLALELLGPDGSVEVEADLASLAIDDTRRVDGALSLGPVALRGPVLRLRRPRPERATAAPGPQEPAGEALAWKVASIDVSSGRVELLDSDIVFPVEVSAHAADAGSRADHRFPVELELGLAGGRLALRGELGLAPLAWRGSLEWSELQLDALAALLDAAPVELDGGVTRAELLLEIAPGPDGPQRLSLRGNLGASGVALGTPDGALDLGFEALEIAVRRIDVPLGGGAPGVDLERVQLDAPRLAAVRTAAAPATDAGTPPPGDAPRVRVGELVLTRGSLQLEDRTLEPAATTRVEELALSAREIVWPGPRLRDAVLAARLGSGELAVRGALGGEGDRLEASLERLGLRHLSPYADALGYRIRGGSADLRADVITRGGGFAADSELILDKLDLDAEGSGFQEAFGIPLGLAIALLQGPAGDIHLSVPVELGAGGSSSIGLGHALRSALQQAIVGALSSPLKALGALAEGASGLVGLTAPTLAFEPGSSELAGGAVDQLARLADLLASRPELALELHGSTGDTDAAAAGEAVPVALAEARAEALRGRLIEAHGIAAGRVRLGPPEHQGAHVRAELATVEPTPARTSPTPEPPADRSDPDAS